MSQASLRQPVVREPYCDTERFLLIALYSRFGEAWNHISKALPYRRNNTVSNALRHGRGNWLSKQAYYTEYQKFCEMDTNQWKQEVCILRDTLMAQKPDAFPPTYIGDFNLWYLARAENPQPLRPIEDFQRPVYEAGQRVDGGGVPQRVFGMGPAGLDARNQTMIAFASNTSDSIARRAPDAAWRPANQRRQSDRVIRCPGNPSTCHQAVPRQCDYGRCHAHCVALAAAKHLVGGGEWGDDIPLRADSCKFRCTTATGRAKHKPVARDWETQSLVIKNFVENFRLHGEYNPAPQVVDQPPHHAHDPPPVVPRRNSAADGDDQLLSPADNPPFAVPSHPDADELDRLLDGGPDGDSDSASVASVDLTNFDPHPGDVPSSDPPRQVAALDAPPGEVPSSAPPQQVASGPLSECEVEEIGEQLVCGICTEHYTDPVCLPCGHTFCKKCLEQVYIVRTVQHTMTDDDGEYSFNTHTQRRCPSCRDPLPSRMPAVNVDLRNAVLTALRIKRLKVDQEASPVVATGGGSVLGGQPIGPHRRSHPLLDRLEEGLPAPPQLVNNAQNGADLPRVAHEGDSVVGGGLPAPSPLRDNTQNGAEFLVVTNEGDSGVGGWVPAPPPSSQGHGHGLSQASQGHGLSQASQGLSQASQGRGLHGLRRSRLRSRGCQGMSPPSRPFRVGEKVHCRFETGWYEGLVYEEMGEMHVKFGDGHDGHIDEFLECDGAIHAAH